MIKKSTININYANKGKLNQLDTFLLECKRVINIYVDEIWEKQNFSSKFIDFKVGTWLSARMQQCLGKQALEIIKSQRKRKKKTKPVFKGNSIELDQRFVDIQFDKNSFDIWVKLNCLGNKLNLKLPSKKHKHLNKVSLKMNLKKSIKLRKIDGKFYLDLYFKKEAPLVKVQGKTLGVDIGYKKLIATSDGQIIGKDFEDIYNKISRKRQGSKAFKRTLIERNNKINEVINKQLDLSEIKEVVAENLKQVKRGIKGKFRKTFNNKLQRWTYPKVLDKLSAKCEEEGVLLTKINPSYTSQTCSRCGVVDKKNRKGEVYQCACGNLMDADLNAAVNISHLGVYSPQALNKFMGNKIPLNA